MDLKILMVILVYYGVLSAFLLLGGAALSDYSGGAALNDSALTSTEIDQGGLFGTGISFGRFTGLLTIGIGLPDSTPGWFKTLFMLWQSCFLIFTIGWFVSSIWNG